MMCFYWGTWQFTFIIAKINWFPDEVYCLQHLIFFFSDKARNNKLRFENIIEKVSHKLVYTKPLLQGKNLVKTFYYIVSITNSGAIAKLQRLFFLAAEKLSKKCIQILHEIQVQRESISKKKYLLCGKHISENFLWLVSPLLFFYQTRIKRSIHYIL